MFPGLAAACSILIACGKQIGGGWIAFYFNQEWFFFYLDLGHVLACDPINLNHGFTFESPTTRKQVQMDHCAIGLPRDLVNGVHATQPAVTLTWDIAASRNSQHNAGVGALGNTADTESRWRRTIFDLELPLF